jgi:hypothetical protein
VLVFRLQSALVVPEPQLLGQTVSQVATQVFLPLLVSAEAVERILGSWDCLAVQEVALVAELLSAVLAQPDRVLMADSSLETMPEAEAVVQALQERTQQQTLAVPVGQGLLLR